MTFIKNTINSIRQNKKAFVIKVCILMLILLAYIVFHFQQGITIRVNLDESTLIRNGQSATIYYAINDGGFSENHTVGGTNPHYSIYRYIFNIDSPIRSNITQLRLDFDQIRRGDFIYIESMSIKHPFFSERIIDNQAIFQGSHSFHNAELHLLENNVLSLEIFGFDPHFTLPSDAFLSRGLPDSIFILGFFILFVAGIALIMFIPNKLYKNIFNKILSFLKPLRELSLPEIVVFVVGAIALLLYYFDGRLRFLHWGTINMSTTLLIAFLIMLFFLFKSKCKSINFVQSDTQNFHARTYYLFLLLLSLIVYVPALFPSPYFSNDEHLVIEAALGYLDTGNFVRYTTEINYNRAWMHTWLVAQAINLFGLSTEVTRAISALFGVVFILSTYHIIKKITKQANIAFLSAILLLFNRELIAIFTTVRMHALMMPLALWMLYFIFQALNNEMSYKSDNLTTRWLSKNFNFHFGYASIAIIFILLNEHIMFNALVLLFGVAIYIVWIAIEEKQRKFINLSIGMAVILILVAVAFFAHIVLYIRIPFITSLIRGFLIHSGFGWNNILYFWTNVNTPFGPLLGVVFLIIGIAVCISKRKQHPFLRLIVACYLFTIPFFVFFAYRYYAYRYMAFIVPVSVMLISLGYYGISSKLSKASQHALFLLIAVAISGHMIGIYTDIRIEHPKRTYFNRPLQIIANDAQNESLASTPIHTATGRLLYMNPLLYNMSRPGGARSEESLIDHLIYNFRHYDPPISYFFSERERHFIHFSEPFLFFLDNATELLTNIDNAVVHKYHFIESHDFNDEISVADSYLLQIIDIQWENDVAYLTCVLFYNPALSPAIFIGVEITEEGFVMPEWSQHATHRFQIFLPEDFNQATSFTLPIRPKTEAFDENINFTFSNSLFIYMGNDEMQFFEYGLPLW